MRCVELRDNNTRVEYSPLARVHQQPPHIMHRSSASSPVNAAHHTQQSLISPTGPSYYQQQQQQPGNRGGPGKDQQARLVVVSQRYSSGPVMVKETTAGGVPPPHSSPQMVMGASHYQLQHHHQQVSQTSIPQPQRSPVERQSTYQTLRNNMEMKIIPQQQVSPAMDSEDRLKLIITNALNEDKLTNNNGRVTGQGPIIVRSTGGGIASDSRDQRYVPQPYPTNVTRDYRRTEMERHDIIVREEKSRGDFVLERRVGAEIVLRGGPEESKRDRDLIRGADEAVARDTLLRMSDNILLREGNTIPSHHRRIASGDTISLSQQHHQQSSDDMRDIILQQRENEHHLQQQQQLRSREITYQLRDEHHIPTSSSHLLQSGATHASSNPHQPPQHHLLHRDALRMSSDALRMSSDALRMGIDDVSIPSSIVSISQHQHAGDLTSSTSLMNRHTDDIIVRELAASRQHEGRLVMPGDDVVRDIVVRDERGVEITFRGVSGAEERRLLLDPRVAGFQQPDYTQVNTGHFFCLLCFFCCTLVLYIDFWGVLFNTSNLIKSLYFFICIKLLID